MSNSKAAQGATSTGKFSLTRKISEFFKLGDDGKLDSFFSRMVKSLTKEVTAHKKNLDNLKFNYDQKIDELNDSLEDAETALAEAFLKVDVEQIATNALQSDFQEIYLSNLDTHEYNVKSIEKEIETETNTYTTRKEEIEKSIASLEKRIKTISQE